MDVYFLEGLARAQCSDLLNLAKGLDAITEPDDLDWLFAVNNFVDGKILMKFRTKLISSFQILSGLNFKEVESSAFINLCIPRKKDPKTSELVLANEILVSSLGNAANKKDPKKTDLVIGKPRRPHLFLKDDWMIDMGPFINNEEKIEIIPKTSSQNPWQPVFDKCLKMLHLDKPETVDLEGLLTILLYRSRGESYFPTNSYAVLKKLCEKGKNNSKLSRLLKRRLESHPANPIAVVFNTAILKARVTLKKEKNQPWVWSKKFLIFKHFGKKCPISFQKRTTF